MSSSDKTSSSPSSSNLASVTQGSYLDPSLGVWSQELIDMMVCAVIGSLDKPHQAKNVDICLGANAGVGRRFAQRDLPDDVSSLQRPHACCRSEKPIIQSQPRTSRTGNAAQSPHYVTTKPHYPRNHTSRRYRHAIFHRTSHETFAMPVSPDQLCHTCRRRFAASHLKSPRIRCGCCG